MNNYYRGQLRALRGVLAEAQSLRRAMSALSINPTHDGAMLDGVALLRDHARAELLSVQRRLREHYHVETKRDRRV
jgi:hypothetical protein